MRKKKPTMCEICSQHRPIMYSKALRAWICPRCKVASKRDRKEIAIREIKERDTTHANAFKEAWKKREKPKTNHVCFFPLGKSFCLGCGKQRKIKPRGFYETRQAEV